MFRRIIWAAAATASVVIILTALLYPHKGWEKNGSELVALALALHYEGALAEPYAGYRAIAHVVFNRVESKDFPDTVREVVAQGTGPGKRSGCQFSFACDGEPDYPNRLCELHPRYTTANGPFFCERRWVYSLALAGLWLYVYRGSDPTEDAVLYYTGRKPYWADKDLVPESIMKIGSHTFGRSRWLGRDLARK